ncbi:hypothetical protein BASA83_013815 [Batrachochytrium salamandrivorans]|nr:hypothetical protein BASA83_013815 [Batrachochytrium salamandrivorans]
MTMLVYESSLYDQQRYKCGYTLLGNEEKVGHKISGRVGAMVTGYLGRGAYVNAALDRWSQNSLDSTLDAVKSVLGDDKYSEVEPGITKRIKEWKDDSRKGTHDIADYTSRILGDDGTVIENLQKIGKASQNIIESRGVVFWILKIYLRILELIRLSGSSWMFWIVTSNSEITTQTLGRSLDPGVENVYTWLRGGVLNGEADLDQRWLDGTVEHESMGTRHDNWVLTARVS